MRKGRGKKTLIATCVLVATMATASIVYAAIPDAGGVIHGCYKTDGGALRVYDSEDPAGDVCDAATEARLDWNQTGPQGPAGPPGVSGYEVVHAASPANSSTHKSVLVKCPEGKAVLGGGGSITSWSAGKATVALTSTSGGQVDSFPDIYGWSAAAREITATSMNWSVDATAVCAYIS